MHNNPLEGEPNDVLIDEEAVDEYERGMNFFYHHLVDLYTNIYILEKVLSFPFQLFIDHDTIFFKQIIVNFLDISVLIVTKVMGDQSSDFYTLLGFKGTIIKRVKPQYREAFQQRLKNLQFDQQTSQLLKKAVALRNKRLAHFKRNFACESSEITIEEELNFSEIKALRDGLNDLFRALSFNKFYHMLPVSYDDGGSSDIEKFLDDIARNSRMLNMPEQQPDWWRDYQHSSLTEEQKEQVNYYRQKFSLSKI